MTTKRNPEEQARLLVIQQAQLCQAQDKQTQLNVALSNLPDNTDNLDAMLAQAQILLDSSPIQLECSDDEALLIECDLLIENEDTTLTDNITLLDNVAVQDDWQGYLQQMDEWAERHKITIADDPFQQLMTASQCIAFEKRIKDEFSLKNAHCDKYDYMLAATCGLIGGLIDIFFVGLPASKGLGKLVDNSSDKFVEKFASCLGWKGANEESKSTVSAIGYLENGNGGGIINKSSPLFKILESLGLINDKGRFKGFKVNYDQATTNGKNGTDGMVNNLSPINHHLKNLGHSPDLIGLLVSIINQFTSTSTFVSNGKIITIDTEKNELHGSNFISKIFAGFVNWLGHLISDFNGSSGAFNKELNKKNRGAGIPIPFYNLLLLINKGKFKEIKNQDDIIKETKVIYHPFSVIATKVFEEGYDFRHGITMSIPVIITELLTRIMWVIKQKYYHDKEWKNCIPSASIPELRRMLLVAHGSLCLVDTTDAALRSGGDMIQFMLRSNLIAWTRLGTLALKELRAWYKEGALDIEEVDRYLEDDYRRILHGK